MPFTVITDHASLKYLQTQPKLSRRQAQWVEKLSEYNFDIQYRPGKHNIVADILSRRPDHISADAPQAPDPSLLGHDSSSLEHKQPIPVQAIPPLAASQPITELDMLQAPYSLRRLAQNAPDPSIDVYNVRINDQQPSVNDDQIPPMNTLKPPEIHPIGPDHGEESLNPSFIGSIHREHAKLAQSPVSLISTRLYPDLLHNIRNTYH